MENLLRTIEMDIAKAKYDITMKSIQYDTKAYNNESSKENMAHLDYIEEFKGRKARLMKRNELELEMIGIEKKILEIDLEHLEDKKTTFSRPPQHLRAEPQLEHSAE